MENKVKAPLSIIIITKNEAGQIRECIESVHGWADEVVIIDDESTDSTRVIASEYTDKVFINKMEIEGKQRNFGASKAKHDWVMMIDADERMTAELKIEIEATLAANNGKVVAYWVPRKNYLADQWLQYGGWYPGTHIKQASVPRTLFRWCLFQRGRPCRPSVSSTFQNGRRLRLHCVSVPAIPPLSTVYPSPTRKAVGLPRLNTRESPRIAGSLRTPSRPGLG